MIRLALNFGNRVDLLSTKIWALPADIRENATKPYAVQYNFIQSIRCIHLTIRLSPNHKVDLQNPIIPQLTNNIVVQ